MSKPTRTEPNEVPAYSKLEASLIPIWNKIKEELDNPESMAKLLNQSVLEVFRALIKPDDGAGNNAESIISNLIDDKSYLIGASEDLNNAFPVKYSEDELSAQIISIFDRQVCFDAIINTDKQSKIYPDSEQYEQLAAATIEYIKSKHVMTYYDFVIKVQNNVLTFVNSFKENWESMLNKQQGSNNL